MRRALGQDTRPFRLDTVSAESALNAVALIEAHVEEARAVMEAWPEATRVAGLPAAVFAYRDQFLRLQRAYERVRRVASEVLLDGAPRDILVDDWDMLKVLDDVSATLAHRASDVAEAQGGARDLMRVRPVSASTIASEYRPAAGIGALETAGLAAAALMTAVAVAALAGAV